MSDGKLLRKGNYLMNNMPDCFIVGLIASKAQAPEYPRLPLGNRKFVARLLVDLFCCRDNGQDGYVVCHVGPH